MARNAASPVTAAVWYVSIQAVDRSLFRKLLAIGFCLFLAWRAIGSLLSLSDEVRAYDVRSLAAAVSLSEEERIERALAGDYAIFTTLNDRVPRDGSVLFVTGSTLPTVKRAMRIGILLYPPRFALAGRLLPLVPRGMAMSNAPVFAVDLVRQEAAAPQAWELVEAGSDFQLWRYRAPESRP
jgi:hypothetical protein